VYKTIFVEFIPCLGCPRRIRADYGTENCLAAKLQIGFHLTFEDEDAAAKSFIYGPSTANIVKICICITIYRYYLLLKRIEAFWSQFRRSMCDWWIRMFHVSFY